MSQLINTTVGAGKSMLGDSEETKAMGCAAGCLSMSFELHLVGSLTLGFMLVLPEFLVADTFLNSFPFAVGIIIAFALYDLVFLMWHPRYVRGSGWLVTSCAQTGSHVLSSLSLFLSSFSQWACDLVLARVDVRHKDRQRSGKQKRGGAESSVWCHYTCRVNDVEWDRRSRHHTPHYSRY